MKVVVAGSAGFCYGVKRALDTVLETAKAHGKLMFTLGPLIHNPQVIEKLDHEGIKSVTDLNRIPSGSILVMPSHGVDINVLEAAKARKLEIIDVTCPFVSKVHQLAEDLVKQGYQVIVIGDEGHTEVKSIMSRAGDDAFATSEVGEIKDRKVKQRVGILAQTTQTIQRYQQLVAEISKHATDVQAYNTICNATAERQKAAVATAGSVDVMIVVGGRNSANTRRLAEICADTGVPTFHVEVASEIDESWFDGAGKVGVTAGASTPDWIIREVVKKVKEIPPTE